MSNGRVVATDKKRDKKSKKGDSSGGESSGPAQAGNKFSTTWRPVGDYVHLKVQFSIQDTTLQVIV